MTNRPAREPSPLGRGRRPRMTEQQTRDTMLCAALGAIQRSGLSLGLEDISMEDAIRDAGVSRTTAYRCWPTKDLFIADLILELAAHAIPAFDTRQHETTRLMRELVLPRLEALADPAARWDLAEELIRQASVADFEIARTERVRWQTYFALLVMLPQLPAGRLRDQLRTALGAAERQYRVRLTANHQVIASMLGFRLADPQHMSAEQVADLVIALWRGLVLHAEAVGVGAREDDGEPARNTSAAASLPALGAAAILTRCYEVDPTIDWATHCAELRHRLLASDDIFAAPTGDRS